jgi:putative drug exporter of the RND superfamily
MLWDRIAAAVTGRRSWLLALGLFVIGSAFMVLVGNNAAAGQAPLTLPPTSDAARADALAHQFPGSGQAALIVVVSRADAAALDPADVAAATEARDRMQAVIRAGSSANEPPPEVSADGKVALTVVPISAQLSGLSLDHTVVTVRRAAGTGLPPGLEVHVTGGPAFGADIANAFSGANVTLLVVTASVVALLLIATYRSPVLWLLPLIVIGFADRVATSVGTAVAALTGLSFDGATSGITSVLVFGAGTNYALLLISRYRQELRRHSAHRDALQRAIRSAGPAILASNATVVLALLTLILAVVPSTRSLGALAACGLVVAAASVLVLLPPLLALCGRRVFWPFIPHPDDGDGIETGPWRWIADWVACHPAVIGAAAIAVLAALAAGLLGTRIGLSQTEQFRVRADSVSGFQILADHFPAGLASPTIVIASSARAAQVDSAITATGGVVSANESGRSPSGLTKWTIVTNSAPSTTEAFETVAALRNSIGKADPAAVVGGADAQALDVRDGATRDRQLLIPAILAVIVAVLYVLLRSAFAPPTLLAASILGALAALGSGGWASLHVFGFPGLDDSTPLFAFLFLAALGVDYTIFLVTRAREEAALHGARGGMVRAVSATGGVITSAGIVLAAVFCVLGVLPLIVLTQLGIIVGLGILLDTFIVRTLVIPALFAMIGDRIWWPTKVGEGKAVKTKYEGRHRE